MAICFADSTKQLAATLATIPKEIWELPSKWPQSCFTAFPNLRLSSCALHAHSHMRVQFYRLKQDSGGGSSRVSDSQGRRSNSISAHRHDPFALPSSLALMLWSKDDKDREVACHLMLSITCVQPPKFPAIPKHHQTMTTMSPNSIRSRH